MNIALKLPSRRRLGAAAAVVVGTASTLSGCGSTAAQAVTKKVPLIVCAAEGYDANTVAAFQAKTGTTTQLVDDSTGPRLARIQASINNLQWGLLGSTAIRPSRLLTSSTTWCAALSPRQPGQRQR